MLLRMIKHYTLQLLLLCCWRTVCVHISSATPIMYEIGMRLSKALWNQSSDNEFLLVTHPGAPLDRFKRIERLQPLRGDRNLASTRFTVPIVRPAERKRVLTSLYLYVTLTDAWLMCA